MFDPVPPVSMAIAFIAVTYMLLEFEFTGVKAKIIALLMLPMRRHK